MGLLYCGNFGSYEVTGILQRERETGPGGGYSAPEIPAGRDGSEVPQPARKNQNFSGKVIVNRAP
jgi:hypothetical protein